MAERNNADVTEGDLHNLSVDTVNSLDEWHCGKPGETRHLSHSTPVNDGEGESGLSVSAIGGSESDTSGGGAGIGGSENSDGGSVGGGLSGSAIDEQSGSGFGGVGGLGVSDESRSRPSSSSSENSQKSNSQEVTLVEQTIVGAGEGTGLNGVGIDTGSYGGMKMAVVGDTVVQSGGVIGQDQDTSSGTADTDVELIAFNNLISDDKTNKDINNANIAASSVRSDQDNAGTKIGLGLFSDVESEPELRPETRRDFDCEMDISRHSDYPTRRVSFDTHVKVDSDRDADLKAENGHYTSLQKGNEEPHYKKYLESIQQGSFDSNSAYMGNYEIHIDDYFSDSDDDDKQQEFVYNVCPDETSDPDSTQELCQTQDEQIIPSTDQIPSSNDQIVSSPQTELPIAQYNVNKPLTNIINDSMNTANITDTDSIVSDIITPRQSTQTPLSPRSQTVRTSTELQLTSIRRQYPETSKYTKPRRYEPVNLRPMSYVPRNLNLSSEDEDGNVEQKQPNVKLEDSVLRDNESYTLKGDESVSPAKIPARIREIITKNLSGDDSALTRSTMTTPTSSQLTEENRLLAAELNRVEDLLSQSRADRDELGIKYNALSERLETSMKGDSGYDASDIMSKSIVQQNVDLRRKLEEEQATYKRKLQAYQDGQQRQAQLVQKLQAKITNHKMNCDGLEHKMWVRAENSFYTKEKVLQYKQKCLTLEREVGSRNVAPLQNTTDSLQHRLDHAEQRLKMAETDHAMDLETALTKLEEERQRSESLSHVNEMLREQLDQATLANQSLKTEVHQVSLDAQKSRDELDSREAQWRDEEQSFNDYFSSEHSRLLSLWREVVAYRRQFNELKMATERDMSVVKGEVTKTSRAMQSACLNLSANLRGHDTQTQVSLDRERSDKAAIENQLRERVRENVALQAKYDATQTEMNARVHELTLGNEKYRMQLEEKTKSVATLQKSVAQIEARLGEKISVAEPGETENTRVMRQETEALHLALRDIAQAVINDADQDLTDGDIADDISSRGRTHSPHHRGRSSSPVSRSRSPALANATFSAVQAALGKRQLQVQELRAKLSATKDQSSTLRRHLDDLENDRRKLEQSILQLKDENDVARRDREDANRDCDRYKNALAAADLEKCQMEKLRQALNDQTEALNQENEKLQYANTELQRQRDNVEDERDDMKKDKERQIRENERCHKQIEQMDQKISNLREDNVSTKESLNQARLDKDVLDHQKTEANEALSKAEMCKAELELEINKVKTEDASLRDALLKMQGLNEGLGQDKIDLNRLIMQLEADKTALHGDKQALEQERMGMREELVKIEQEKLDVETDKMGLAQNLELSEATRQQLEDEISALNRDRADLTDQLNNLARQKQALSDDLLQLRRENDRQTNTVVRLSKEKETLTQGKGELVVQLTASERENRQQSETIAALTADKEGLEGVLYETQQNLQSLEVRKEQLEGENQDLLIKKEQLQGEIQRISTEKEAEVDKLERQREALTIRAQQVEQDLSVALAQEKQAHAEDVDRLARDKATAQTEHENEVAEIVHANNLERDEMKSEREREREALTTELAATQRDRDDKLIMAEHDKQQALSLLEQEKITIQERLLNSQHDLGGQMAENERIKREYYARQEQDKQTMNAMQSELRMVRQSFDEAGIAHEKEVKDLSNQINELVRQREAAVKEVNELRVQLKMAEEGRENLRRELLDANRAIREGEEQQELMRKNILDLKRTVNDEVHEKEAVGKTADELRGKVKKVEGEKVELNRALQDAKQKISVLEEQKTGVEKEANDLRMNLREVEKARLEARRELQELRRHIKQLDAERTKLGKEVNDLQTRVARDEEREEESRRTSFDLKQKVVETEASREALRKEIANVQRKLAESMEEGRVKEKDFHLTLEDARRNEKRLDEQRTNLAYDLENANAEIAELKLKLSGAEGRVNALEMTLARLEGTKRDVEFKLSSIASSLRRTIGFRPTRPRSQSPTRARTPSPRRSRPNSPTKGFENTYTTTTDGAGTPIPRTGSPERAITSRNASPSRGGDVSQILPSDVDPEAVRLALRDFVSQMAYAERERDDAIAQTKCLATQLEEVEEDKKRTEGRLNAIHKSLSDVEEDKRGIDGRLASAQTALMLQEEKKKNKRGIDGRLASAQTALMLQEETMRRNEREHKVISEKASNLERALAAADTEKRQLYEKMNQMKQNEAKLEDDKRILRVALDDAENRCTKIELQRRGLEGDLQRLRLAMNDKDTENSVLQDRVENLMRQVTDLEEKAGSLQITIERLQLALAKTEEDGHSQKDKIQNLNCSISDSNQTIGSLGEKIDQLQKALTSSEHDRRMLHERLDTSKMALDEAKKQNHGLLERVQILQGEGADTEVRRAELEVQLRQSANMLLQRQESESQQNESLQKLAMERQSLQEHVSSLQRALGNVETERREMERNHVRLEKDKTALKKTLDKVEREKLVTEEIATKSVADRGSIDRHMERIETDNVELQRHVQTLQAELAEAEQQHAQRLIDLTTRHRTETEMETERLRSAQRQAESTLEAREKAHRQRMRGLEEQVATLKDQFSLELRKRQQYISRSSRAGDEIRDIRNLLDNSLSNVTRDANLDAGRLSHEARKLDDSIDDRYASPTRLSPRHRSPVRLSSPARPQRVTSTPGPRAGSKSRNRPRSAATPMAFRK